jgi:hypothetical protein
MIRQFYAIVIFILNRIPENWHNNCLFLLNCLRLNKKYYILNKNKISTFNEYINNSKVNDIISKSHFSNKLLLKSLVFNELNVDIETAPIIYVFNSIEEFESFDWNLGKFHDFIIKANHGSGMNLIFKNGVLPSSKDLNRIRKWFTHKSDIYHREYHYNLIEKKIFVEALIGFNINDYKVHCYNGVCKIIQVDLDRFFGHKRLLYDVNWNRLDFEYVYPTILEDIVKPDYLNEILEKSVLISKHFEYVRIDWYETAAGIYLGELTFHPEGGVGPFKSKQQDIDFFNFLKSR